MPLIAGALYTTKKAEAIAHKLLALSKALIVDNEVIIDDVEAGIALISGRIELESTAEQVKILSDGLTLLAGRLFHKEGSYETATDLSPSLLKTTKGTLLGDDYWGRYLVVSFDKNDKSVRIYRDPQGLSTIFYMHSGGALLFSTEISLLYDALEEKPPLNWSYLTSYVVNAHNITSATPFEGIIETVPGCMTELSPTAAPKIIPFWDPTKIPSKFIQDEQAFMENIYQTLALSTAALSREADKIVVQLSGGLDSSSVLSVLKDVMPKESDIRALNVMHSQVASSNEVEYAKNVTDICSVPLQVLDLKLRPAFTNKRIERRFNRPYSGLLDYEATKELREELTFLGTQGEIMGGQGGDHLFLAPAPVESVTDYFLKHGFFGINNIVSQISHYNRTPYLKVLGKAALGGINYVRGSMSYFTLTLTTTPWMTQSFNSLVDASMFRPHQWDVLKKVHPGKAQHIFMISSATHYVDRGYFFAGKSELNPLLAQPMVELALSMPTYQSFGKGYDRVLFRGAIAHHKKGNFIWRKSKGETSGALILSVRNSYEKITELLLNGYFIRQGLIDKELLNHGIDEMRHGKMDNSWPILNLINAELWLRSWDDGNLRYNKDVTKPEMSNRHVSL